MCHKWLADCATHLIVVRVHYGVEHREQILARLDAGAEVQVEFNLKPTALKALYYFQRWLKPIALKPTALKESDVCTFKMV